jgi:hypothetical protein
MPTYVWCCHVCGSSNSPLHESCASCQFPAVASGHAIYAARSARIKTAQPTQERVQPPPTNFALRNPRFWKAFLAISVIYELGGATYSFVVRSDFDPLLDLCFPLVSVVSLIPLYGYVFQRSVRPKWLWLTVLWITAIGLLLTLPEFFTSAPGESLGMFAYTVVELVLLLLYLFALNQYLYRSPHLWLPNQQNTQASVVQIGV